MMGKIRSWVGQYFIYGALLVSIIILFKPGGDGPLPFPQADKVLHALTFALLALGLWWRRVRWKLILVVLLAYAVSSEIVQHFFIPGREFELLDIVADTVGASLVVAFQSFKRLN